MSSDADMKAVDAIVSKCRQDLAEIDDKMMRMMSCMMVVPFVAEHLYHRVLAPLYGVRALYIKGHGRVQIAVSSDVEPASVVFAFDAHMLEVLLNGEIERFTTCAELVDWLKEHVPL